MSENNSARTQQPPRQRGGMHGGPGGALGRPVEKAKDFRGTLRRLVRTLRPQAINLLIVAIFAILSTVFTVRSPKISGDAINQLTDGFIAKNLVSSISQAQTEASSKIGDQLKQMDDGINAAVAQYQAAAKAQVDQGYLSALPAGTPASALPNIPGYSDKLKQAQDSAAQQATTAATQAILDKAGLTADQLQALRDMNALPNVKTLKTGGEKADTVQKFIDLGKKMPASMMEQGSTGGKSTTKISDSDLKSYIADIRETNGVIPFDAIWKTLMKLLAIFAASALTTFIMQFVMSGVAQKTVYGLRRDVDSKLARLPLKYYDQHTNGEILSRMTNDIDTISSTLQQSLTQLITSIMQIIGYIWMMLTISVHLTLIVLATLPLYILVTMLIAKNSQKHFAAQQKHLGRLSGHTEEMYTGHKIVRVFGHEKDSIETFEKINDELYEAGWRAQFLSGIMFPMMNFISNIGYVLIAVVGGIYVTKNWLKLGSIVSFIQYSRSFSMPIIQTANIANVIQSTIACAERVFEVLDEPEEIPDAEDARELSDPRGDVVFDHVKFSYDPEKPLIEDMNLDIKRGETVAIVGPTGAGKTTLVNLLMRFYEIGGGSITFDGVDLRDFRRGSLRTMFGMVLQDTWLFNGTIEDNIRYGREGSTHEQIVAAAKAAHADHFIRSLPDGYNTILNEEASNISQGQKQLLTIARAILADPTVLILDEATSSVDTRTEVLIQKAMGRLMEGRTNFVIAHRLSTIRDAKLILVMNHGSIIESGSHQQLLEKKGFYADLYNSQFTGPAVEEQAV